jgi:hypothetical protein
MTVSWDCFDTLIGRKLQQPRSVFDEISKITGDVFFTQKRIKAEKNSTKKTLEDIYSFLPEHDLDLEIEVEKIFSFPILENFNSLCDGDIVVSDMYLSDKQIRSILEHNGLNKDIIIYSTYGGKGRGWVWDQIKQKHNIKYHIGDNLKADVRVARQHGIKGIYYAASDWTPYETEVKKHSYVYASLARFIRLSNPYSLHYGKMIHDTGSFQNVGGLFWKEESDGIINNFFTIQNDEDIVRIKKIHKMATVYLNKTQKNISVTFDKSGTEKIKPLQVTDPFWLNISRNTPSYLSKILWDEQAIFNIPILLSFIYSLPSHKPLVFLYRDCLHLKKIYDTLFSDKNSSHIQVSRKAYNKPYNDEFIDYLLGSARDRILVDLHGTGQSTKSFFDAQNTPFEIFFLCKHKPSWSQYQEYNKHVLICNDRHDSYSNISGSKKKMQTCRGTMLEKLNLPHNMGELINWQNGIPIRATPSEHNPEITKLYDECINFTIKNIGFYKDKLVSNQNIIDLLLTILIKEETLTDNSIDTLWDRNKHPVKADFFDV